MTSLNPVLTVGKQIGETVQLHARLTQPLRKAKYGQRRQIRTRVHAPPLQCFEDFIRRIKHANGQAAQALGFLDPATGAFVPPIQPATTYERGTDNKLLSGRLYSRADNPNYDQVEAVLTHLERGAAKAGLRSARPCCRPSLPLRSPDSA